MATWYRNRNRFKQTEAPVARPKLAAPKAEEKEETRRLSWVELRHALDMADYLRLEWLQTAANLTEDDLACAFLERNSAAPVEVSLEFEEDEAAAPKRNTTVVGPVGGVRIDPQVIAMNRTFAAQMGKPATPAVDGCLRQLEQISYGQLYRLAGSLV